MLNVDETKGSKRVLTTFRNVIGHAEEVILLHVAQPEGRTLMTAMLGEPGDVNLEGIAERHRAYGGDGYEGGRKPCIL